MKILHIIYTEGVSGAEKHIRHLLPGLGAYGISCELMLICPPAAEKQLKDFCNEFSANGIKTTMVIVKRSLSLKAVRSINKYLRGAGISTVHSHLIRTDILVTLVKKFFFPKLFIISTRHGYREEVQAKYQPDHFIITRDFYYYVTKYLLKKIDRNISISKCISELFVNFKLTKEYFPVIYHGLEVAPVNKAGLSSFKKASPQLVIVGRLEEYKGHRYALEAMPAILEKYPAAKLLLLGDGSYRSSLAVLVAEAGIAESVLFLGFQKDPLSFISASEIVIIPSLFEPFGLVFIEAMALRKPIAAFDVPAGNELLNADTAALVPRKDSNALAEKILILLDDQHLRETIAANAYAAYRERFTTEVMVRNTAGFYRSLKIN